MYDFFLTETVYKPYHKTKEKIKKTCVIHSTEET